MKRNALNLVPRPVVGVLVATVTSASSLLRVLLRYGRPDGLSGVVDIPADA